MRGQRVAGRYLLEEQIGSGGMGVVWRATDEELGRVVALKRAHVADGDASVQEMRREARLAAGVQHPNVVTLFDLVADGAARWLVMEYLPSRSLADIIREAGSLSVGQVARIGAQLASALRAVHARGLVHRDIKPGNVLVTADGTAKLTDFGVSRPAWGEVTLADTPGGAGTPAYLAPEVANGGEPTQASDVFSLGATLFAAVEGSSPYGTADNSLAMLRRAATYAVTQPHRAGVLAPVLTALLRADPAKRPDPDWSEQRLTDVAAERADDTVRLPGDPPPWYRRLSRRTTVVGAAALVALAGGAALLVALSMAPTPGSPSQRAGGAALDVGNPRTVDPCGLMNAMALNRFGKTDRETDYGNFNRCDILVTSARDSESDVLVELETKEETPDPSTGRRSTDGALAVLRLPSDGDACQRFVSLPDGNLVVITAKYDHGPQADLCAMSDAATTSATRVLNRDGVPRRQAPPPVGSLANLDACAVLEDSRALSRVPGNDATRTDTGFARWTCAWHSSASDLGVLLDFDRGNELTPGHDGRLTRLSGRQVFIEPDGDSSCLALVVYRPYTGIDGARKEELVKLSVQGAAPTKRLCSVATDLAGAVAARLPPT